MYPPSFSVEVAYLGPSHPNLAVITRHPSCWTEGKRPGQDTRPSATAGTQERTGTAARPTAPGKDRVLTVRALRRRVRDVSMNKHIIWWGMC